MKHLVRALPAYLLAAFLVFMGMQKFIGDVPIFQIIETNVLAKTGFNVDLIEPAGRYLTGVLELLAAALLIIRRLWGALLSITVIGGAILAHLTFLGVSTPVSAEPGAPESPVLFFLALVFFAISLGAVWIERLSAAKTEQDAS